MNIYKKLQTCRVALQQTAIKKSGHNKFAGYTYYELGDFLPTIQNLFNEHGLCGAVTFNAGVATLTIYDADSEATISFTSPMAEANLKGCHPIQNLGAVQTYQRRYLWQAAMEIVEHDAVDAVTAKASDKEPKALTKQPYSDADFDKNLPAWAEKIADGSTTGAKIIAIVETKYTLSPDQKTVLTNA